MYIVLITAVGVGGATLFGSVLGFVFKNICAKIGNVVLAFSAGVMLVAAINGLILPSLEYDGGIWTLPTTVLGIFSGAFLIFLLDGLVPAVNKILIKSDSVEISDEKRRKLNKVTLFVLAIAIHNLPEGIAAGVGFGTGNIGDAITVALGIALQNIPEGMVIISPMLSAGISQRRTFFYAALTGVIEIIGTLIGYFAVSISYTILPFALALAGGTMLYVISEEIIPETHNDGGGRAVSLGFLIGFCFMLALNFYL